MSANPLPLAGPLPPAADAPWRKTSQFLLPAHKEPAPAGVYDIYPVHPLDGPAWVGFAELARAVSGAGTLVVDGFPGVLWEDFRERLGAALAARGVPALFHNVEAALRPPAEIDALIAPFLGGGDPLFGFRYPGGLEGFFDPRLLSGLRPDPDAARLNVLYGTGAALAGWDGLLVYVDVPKNEIQFRARARSVKNLGASAPLDPKPAYKRSYFVDWPAANRHKAALLPKIDLFVDGQRPDEPAFTTGAALRGGLAGLARGYFRPRPWFEPGPWGGQWIKANIPQLNPQVPNYAWSFELITPENGLIFASAGVMVEVSFDLLMFQEHRAVLGACADNFAYEFPIRYDFLDTIAGGNLSVQCHPRPEYIRAYFGETFTQDETYYILESTPTARVNLGFQAGVDPAAFKAALLHSASTAEPVDIPRFVMNFPAQKHDLFLIPAGTVHGSGEGSLVLEISATPYIFTFKMYDWLRLDLDGKPRSLNVERAFENLSFDRQGERVERELISHPRLLREGLGWRVLHLPTHPHHFYDVHRYEFNASVDLETGGADGSCHVLSLVEGTQVLLETQSGARARFMYAETFVVPAAAGSYRLTSESGEALKVVVTFVKPREQWQKGVVPNA